MMSVGTGSGRRRRGDGFLVLLLAALVTLGVVWPAAPAQGAQELGGASNPTSGSGGEAKPPASAPMAPLPVPATQVLKGSIDPRTFLLGPGDLLQLKIGVRPPIIQEVRVSPEGRILLAEGPSVLVAGMSLAAAESSLVAVLAEFYVSRDVELRLLDLRTFGVYVVGQGTATGMITAGPADRVSEVVSRGGGIGESASRRAIQVFRADGRVLSADLGLFEATGSLDHNPLVEAGDRILIPPRAPQGQVTGAVNRGGIIEVLPGDSVATALALAYGVREDALPDSAYLESFENSPTQTSRRYINLASPGDRAHPFRERDLLFVRPRPRWTPTRTVKITGEVQRPGVHALPADSVRLRRVIEMAGGITQLASLSEAYVLREPSKLPLDPEFERLSKLSSAEMSRDEYEYYSLRLRTRKPTISVDFPGLFLRGESEYDVYIRPGDEIVIPRTQPYVSVVGEVVRPGSIPFVSNMGVEAYVARAGGYSSRAARHDVAVIRGLTGEWSKKNRSVSLGPGDTIWVPKKPERKVWKTTLETIAVVSQLATVYVVITNAVTH